MPVSQTMAMLGRNAGLCRTLAVPLLPILSLLHAFQLRFPLLLQPPLLHIVDLILSDQRHGGLPKDCLVFAKLANPDIHLFRRMALVVFKSSPLPRISRQFVLLAWLFA
jgi:hypothetical protein